MARLYTNENIAYHLVEELRALGHDVLTSQEAGNANRSVPDREVLEFATSEERIPATHNRRHFLQLHHRRIASHAGIVLCTVLDYAGQAGRIHAAVGGEASMLDTLVRVNRQEAR